jgi:hypothetical protein
LQIADCGVRIIALESMDGVDVLNRLQYAPDLQA